MTDLQRAWNRFKKEITADGDQFRLKGCMYMTQQQMAKHTATLNLGCVEVDAQAPANKAKQIVQTDAFKKLSDQIGITSCRYEVREDSYYHMCLYMRIFYKA